jgi:uncharacterized DUF497 family protein
VNFEWDPSKASKNRRKHGVTFHEAATAFGDPLPLSYQDPDHSDQEQRFITVGMSNAVRHRLSGSNMNKKPEKRKLRDELRPKYDLSKLKGGARGKYAVRYVAGTNLVLLSPDVAEHFPDDRSVNSALRRLIREQKGRSAGRANASATGPSCRTGWVTSIRLGFENEVNGLRFAAGDGHGLSLLAVRFVPSSDGVAARGQVRQLELSVIGGNRIV